MNVYLVQCEYRVDGEDGFELTHICRDKDTAIAIMETRKDDDLAAWRTLRDANDIVIENDHEELFQMQVNEWEDYVEWRVVTKEITEAFDPE